MKCHWFGIEGGCDSSVCNLQSKVYEDHLLRLFAKDPTERICPSGGSIGRIWSRFGVGVRSFSWNRSVKNGGVLGESSSYFCEVSRRLSTGQEWDWHAPDAC
jgi:hypothetical protein